MMTKNALHVTRIQTQIQLSDKIAIFIESRVPPLTKGINIHHFLLKLLACNLNGKYIRSSIVLELLHGVLD